MKNLIKLALAFTLGIIIALAIIPKFLTNPDPAEPTPTPDIQAEIQRAVDTAVTEALASAELKAEPVTIAAVQEAEPAEVEELPEPEETEEEPEPTPTPEPAAEPVRTQTATTPKAAPVQPETFFEDGKEYAYINGIKTYIAPDDEPAVQSETYDWLNDPAKDITGPFN